MDRKRQRWYAYAPIATSPAAAGVAAVAGADTRTAVLAALSPVLLVSILLLTWGFGCVCAAARMVATSDPGTRRAMEDCIRVFTDAVVSLLTLAFMPTASTDRAPARPGATDRSDSVGRSS